MPIPVIYSVPFRSKPFFALVLSALICLLTGCGGGGGGGGSSPKQPLTLNLSNASTVSFSAASPLAATPATQNISATVTGEGSGTLYVLVDFDGAAVSNVSNILISGNTGQATITPAAPKDLGAGVFTSTIHIRACLNDPTCASGQIAGSPKTLAVNYTVGATTPSDAVMPHVLTEGQAGALIIRGSQLSSVSSVQIGGVQATSVAVISDTELHVNYPTLTAGNKSIALNGGSILFSGSVAVVPAANLPIANLTFSPAPTRIASLIYDAERQAILVSAVFSNGSNNVLWRYTVVGGVWTLTTSATILNLNDIELSADGARIIAVAGNSIQELDPVTLTTIKSVAGPALQNSAQLTGIAISNDGSAIVSSGMLGSSGTPPWFSYSLSAGTFQQIQAASIYSHDLIAPPMIATADGAHILVTPAGFIHTQIYDYVAATGRLKSSSVFAKQAEDQPVAISANGSLTIPYTDNFQTQAFDPDGNLLGFIANNGDSKLVIINPQGTRAYIYEATNNKLHTYDLTSQAIYNEIGSSIDVTLPIPDISSPVKTAITPDGSSIFLAGINGLLVMTTP